MSSFPSGSPLQAVSRRRVLQGAVALAATVIATACGGAEKAATQSAAARTAPTTASGSATGATGSTAAAAPSTVFAATTPNASSVTAPAGLPASTSVATTAANASATTGGNTVNVVEKDFAIALDKATVSAGSVTFTIKNDGPSPHNLAFPDLKKVSETLDAGKTSTLTLDLKPGAYTYICNIPGHEQLGMKGMLTVK